jgi:hypothetical protein
MSFSVGGSIFWSGTSHRCRRVAGAEMVAALACPLPVEGRDFSVNTELFAKMIATALS